MDDQGSRVRFLVGLGTFLFTTTSRRALGVKRPGVKLTTHLHLVLRSKNA
jgi:hypothetical protein